MLSATANKAKHMEHLHIVMSQMRDFLVMRKVNP